MSSSAELTWLPVTVMFSWLASFSRTLNRTSQPSTSLGICAAVSWTDLAYGLAAVLRLDTSLLSWLLEIVWLPTVAAAPILTGPHPAISPPRAAAATAAFTPVGGLVGWGR